MQGREVEKLERTLHAKERELADAIHDIEGLVATNSELATELATLQSAVDCACSALTDSICASGNDAETNLNWVRKLRQSVIASIPGSKEEAITWLQKIWNEKCQLERTLHAKERELAELRKAWVSAYTSLGADEATANVIVNNEIAAYRATIQSVSAAPQEITASDREMIDAIIDGHYERWGSAVKGDLHGMLFLGGKQAQHRAAPQGVNELLEAARVATEQSGGGVT